MYINDPLTATKANRQYTHAYRQDFTARKRARARLEVAVSTRLLVRVRPGIGLALVLLVEQAVVPSGIDEQGVDHGGLLLRLSHLPAADATQRRLELVGEGEVQRRSDGYFLRYRFGRLDLYQSSSQFFVIVVSRKPRGELTRFVCFVRHVVLAVASVTDSY